MNNNKVDDMIDAYGGGTLKQAHKVAFEISMNDLIERTLELSNMVNDFVAAKGGIATEDEQFVMDLGARCAVWITDV